MFLGLQKLAVRIVSGNNKMGNQNPLNFYVLGARVSAVQIPGAIDCIEEFIESGRAGHFIVVINSHLTMEGCKDPIFRDMLNSADMSVPDGMPLLWLAKRHGIFLKKRVCGADLMESFLCRTDNKYSHFF